MRGRLHVSVLILVLLSLELLPNRPVLRESIQVAISPLAPQYAIGALPVNAFRHPGAVGQAVDFILALQPEGTYILTRRGVDDVVPMDIAHAAIALTKAGHVSRARAAMDWLLARQTRPDDPQAVVTKTIDGQKVAVDYSGSWWDHYQTSGDPKVKLTRGRGKGDGLDQGMAYDFYARRMWGRAEGDEAHAELASLRATGLATRHGVRQYDWQRLRARTLVDRLKWWWRGQIVAPSESFDWGIANLVAGDLGTALDIEAAWLPRQDAGGGFPDGYLAGLGLPTAPPTSYTAARFILFERLLTDAVHSSLSD